MSSPQTQKSKYNFLTKTPCGKDLFENKSQESIAKVISDKIINQTDFKIIGIDGEWGSGKSNLVELIQNELKDTHEFFIYDVWGHQEDEHRRSILVELTEFLKSKKRLLKQRNINNWDKKLKDLLSKSKETTTINQPYLSVGFIFSLLSIVYIPTVNVFKNDMVGFLNIRNTVSKVLLVAFPILIVIGIYIWNFIKSLYYKNGICKSFRSAAEETFQVYTNRQKEETKIETITEEQPSVREFRNWMEDINNDLNKPIVIVFDNFDRLPKQHIIEIWSSIHIFFADKPYSNIKVIIPFDKEHVESAFKGLYQSEKKYGADYINKTFDIIFRVPSPIMSDWKGFFRSQWRIAFTQLDEQELEKVLHIYEFLNSRYTPREIIHFINEVITYKFVNEEYALEYIAIFILQKEHILKNPLQSLIDLEYLKGLKNLYIEDLNYAKQITAIVYQLPVDKAIESIYRHKLKQSLVNNDFSSFTTICNAPFINDMFYSVLQEIDDYSNSILLLDQVSKDSSLNEHTIQRSWEFIYANKLNKKLQIIDLELRESEYILFRKFDDDRYLDRVIEHCHHFADRYSMEEYFKVSDRLIEMFGEDKIFSKLNIEYIEPKKFIQLVQIKDKNYERYNFICEDHRIDAYLNELDISSILIIEKLDKVIEYRDVNLFRSKLITYINNEKNILLSTLNYILYILKSTMPNHGNFIDLIDHNNFIYYLNKHQNNIYSNIDYAELVSVILAKKQNSSNAYQNLSFIWSIKDTNFVNKIAETILNYIDYDDFLLLSNKYVNNNLYKLVAMKLIASEGIDKKLDVKKIIEAYPNIKVSLNINDEFLLKELDGYEFDFEGFDLKTFPIAFVDDCFKYEELSISKEFKKAFNKFKDFDIDKLKEVFTNDQNIYFKYFNKLDDASISEKSFEIFKYKFINHIKNDSHFNNELKSIFEKYERILPERIIKDFLIDITQHHKNVSIYSIKGIVLYLLPKFFKNNVLHSYSQEFNIYFDKEFFRYNDYSKNPLCIMN